MSTKPTSLSSKFLPPQGTELITVQYPAPHSPLDPEDAETAVAQLISDECSDLYKKNSRGHFAATVFFEPTNLHEDTTYYTSFAMIEKRDNELFLSFCDITDSLGNDVWDKKRPRQALVKLEPPHPVFQMAMKDLLKTQFDDYGWLKLPETEEEMSNLFSLFGELSALKMTFEAVRTEASMYLDANRSANTFIESVMSTLTKS